MNGFTRRARLVLFASVSAFCSSFACAALAEEAPTSAAVEEVVVTAQKRSENVQNVPISIVALTGSSLAKSGVTTIDSLQHYAPGLSISAVGSGFVSYTYLRGSGTNQIDAGSDPSVAYFEDEVYIGGTAGLQFDLFDIDRVEVLKGPQGTLFGRNAAAGAISIVTKRPSAEFGVTADGEVGNYGDYTGRASVTGPISSDGRWLMRLSAGFKERGAFTDNLAPGGEDPGKVNTYGGRGQLEYAGDNLTFLLTVEAARARDGMTNQFIDSADKSGLLSAAAIAALPPGESFYRHYYNVSGFENQDLAAVSGRFDWKTAIGTITSLSAYRSSTFNRLQDQDGTIADSFALGSHEADKTFSQELRLANDIGRLHWIGGLYYYDGRTTSDFVESAGPAFPVAILGGTQTIDNGVITSHSYAAFGQATFDVSDQLSLTVGGRYTIDHKEDNRQVKGFLAPGFYFVDPTARWSSFDPAASLNFHVTPDVLTYLSYRRGYKSGGFQTLGPATPAIASTPFAPETVNSYEAGVKSTWFDHRLLIDAALFRSDITNQQILRITGPGVQTIDNAGQTRDTGLDLTISARPIEHLRLDASSTFQHARFVKYLNGAVSYAGNAQLRSPDFSGAYSAEYDVELPGGATLTPRVEYTYQSKEFFDAANTQVPGLYQPGFGLTNARLTYTPAQGSWNVALWGRNLGNVEYVRNIATLALTGLAVPGDPRTFGVAFHLAFH